MIVGIVWRSKGVAFKPQTTIQTVKHSGRSIMLFPLSGTDTFHKVDNKNGGICSNYSTLPQTNS